MWQCQKQPSINTAESQGRELRTVHTHTHTERLNFNCSPMDLWKQAHMKFETERHLRKTGTIYCVTAVHHKLKDSPFYGLDLNALCLKQNMLLWCDLVEALNLHSYTHDNTENWDFPLHSGEEEEKPSVSSWSVTPGCSKHRLHFSAN